MDIGRQIHNIIDDRDITQTALADMLGIPLSTLNGYMTGRHQFPPELLREISQHLNITADYLLELAKSPTRPPALSKTELSLVEAFRTLSHDQRELLVQISLLLQEQNRR